MMSLSHWKILGKWAVGIILAVDIVVSALVIVDRYYVRTTLPDLGSTLLNKILIGSHFSMGLLVMLLGPLQFWLNVPIHKITGIIYVTAAMISSLGGLSFMAINTYANGWDRGTVGGRYMTLAFSIFGILWYLCANLAAIYGCRGKRRRHREWALRAYVLGVCPIIYRVLYYISFLAGYTMNRNHPYREFARPLDHAFNWLFFVPALLIMEVIIRIVRRATPRRAPNYESIGISDPLYMHPHFRSTLVITS